MDVDAFGFPLTFWGGLCMAATLITAFTWPSDRVAARSGARRAILRWFQPLFWLMLSGGAFAAGLNILGGATTGIWLVRLGVPVYIVFWLVLGISPRLQPKPANRA